MSDIKGLPANDWKPIEEVFGIKRKKLFLVICNEHNDLIIYAIHAIDDMEARKTCPTPGTIVTVNEVRDEDMQIVCHLQELRHRLV